jgi:hypothetical protein
MKCLKLFLEMKLSRMHVFSLFNGFRDGCEDLQDEPRGGQPVRVQNSEAVAKLLHY